MTDKESLRQIAEQYFKRTNVMNAPNVRDILSYKSPLLEYTLEFLHPNETPLGFLRVGALLWATDSRVIWVGLMPKNGMFDSPKPQYKDLPYISIASVHTEKGGFLGYHKINFHVSTTLASGRVEIVSFQATDTFDVVQEFADLVRTRIKISSQPNTAKEKVLPPSDDLIVQLERLAILREKGALTEDEFNLAKRKLLGT